MTRYCPKCGGEYQDRVENCLDCNEKLVDTKPESRPGQKEELPAVTAGERRYAKEPLLAVASFANTLEAQFSKGVLESEGIASIIANADTVILSGRNSSTVTPINLLVRESQAVKAKEILDSIVKNITEDDIPETDFIEEESEKQ